MCVKVYLKMCRMSRFSFVVSYGGEIIEGHNGVEYVGGFRRLISLNEDVSFDGLCEAISNRIGLKSNQKISKITYKLSSSTTSGVQFMCIDVIDDGDIQQIVHNHTVNTELGYPELFVESRRTRSRGIRGGHVSSVSRASDVDRCDVPTEIGTSSSVEPYMTQASHDEGMQQLDIITEIDIPVATNDCDTPRSQMEDSEGEMDVIRADTDDYEPNLGSSHQHPMNIPPIYEYADMSDVVVTADWIGDTSTVVRDNLEDELQVGMQFEDKNAVKNVVKQYAMRCSREYEVKESNAHNWLVVCRNADSGCGWRVRATQRKRLGEGWEITRYGGPHSCLSRAMSLDHRQLDSSFICSCIIDQVKNDPSKSISSIITEIHSWMHFKPSYKKAWEAKQKAIAQIWGDWDESYRRLPYLLAAIKHFNPGSVVE